MTLLYALCATLICSLPGSHLQARSVGWDYPLEGAHHLVSAFAPPPASAPWLRGNRGVDLAAEPGAVVHAAGAGIVSFAGPLAGRGVVVIVHGELRSTYEPVLASVGVGDRVGLWQPIGRVQPAPSPCPPATCLHWGLLRGSTYLDPMLLLAGPVRLLPWSSGQWPSGQIAVAAPGWGPAAVPARGPAAAAPEPTASSEPAAEGPSSQNGKARWARRAALGVGAVVASSWWWLRRRVPVRVRGAPADRAAG